MLDVTNEVGVASTLRLLPHSATAAAEAIGLLVLRVKDGAEEERADLLGRERAVVQHTEELGDEVR